MLKEKVAVATILDKAKTNDEIATKLKEYGVLCPPCKVGDTVYCIVAKAGLAGSLIYTAHIIERKVDYLFFDGKRWGMRSNELNYGQGTDNCILYLWFGDLVFITPHEANERLEEILNIGKEAKQ